VTDTTWSDDDIEHFDDAYLDELAGHGSWHADPTEVTAHTEHHVINGSDHAGSTTAGEAPPRKLILRWVNDALDNPPEEPVALVGGFLRAGEVTVMGGSRALGKSWATMNLAKLLSEGDGKLFGELPIKRKATTLISQGEVSPWGSWNRWAMLYGKGRPEGVAETFDRWRIRVQKRRTSGADRETGSAWSDEWFEALIDPRLEETIDEHRFDVLVVDPWATYFNGKANDNDEAEKALSKLWEIARKYQTAVLIMHHVSGKIDTYNKEPEDLWRGATRIADSASTRVTMLPHFTEKQVKTMGMSRALARLHVDLHFLNRDGPPIEGFSAKRNPASGMFEKWIPGEAESETDEPRYTYNTVDVIRILTDAPGQCFPSLRAATTAMDCSPNTATKALERAVRSGQVEEYVGKGGARAFRLGQPHLHLVPDHDPTDPGPTPPDDDEFERF
jgi:hypothetical protein